MPPLAPHRSPWASLVLIFTLVTLGAFCGQLIGLRLMIASPEDLATLDMGHKQALLVLQATTASCALIGAPLLYLRFFAPQDTQRLFQWQQSYTMPLLLTLGLTLAFMGVNTWFIQWNNAIKLPTWLSPFEAWAQQKEIEMLQASRLLTTFQSFQELAIGMLVIGVIPAVGEELLFRGLIQRLCYQITHNIHGAIVISALAFSVTHLQFYGLVPRFLLGILFGYVYWWTKDLVFPIAAHFFNNALTLFLLFLYQQEIIAQDITTPVVLPTSVVLLAALLVLILANYLQRLSNKNNP